MKEEYSLYSKEKLIGLLAGRDAELTLAKENCASLVKEKRTLEFNLGERIKELKCHNFISELMMQEGVHQDDFLQQIAGIIPPSWQFPEICQAALTINGKQYKTNGFASSKFSMINEIQSYGKIVGNIEVTYPVDEMPNCEQIFLDEEFVLLKGISERISHYVEKNNFDSELKQSEEKYRLLVENQNELVVKVDTEGKFTYVSPTYCKLFGKTEDELIGKSYFPMIHPDDVEPTEKAVATLSQSPHTCYIEQRAMTTEGWKWLAWSDSAILDKNGNIETIIGVGRDIDDRKKVELSLQKSEAIHRTILNASPDGICFASLDGRIIMVSSSLLNMFGFDKVEEMKDEFILKYVTGESAEIAKTNLKDIIEGTRKGSGVYTGIKKDGTTFEFEANASIVKDNEGNPLNQIIILRDITERINSQEELIASERRYRNIFENVQDVYFETNLDGIILEMTPSISVMSQGMYTRDSMIGTSVGNLYANSDERRMFIEQLQKFGRVHDYELSFRVKSNEIKHLSATAILAFNSEGKPEKIYGTMRDITDRIHAEDELRKFRTIAEQANYANIIAGLDGNLLYANKEVSEKTGYKPEEIIGKHIAIFFNSDQLQVALANMQEIIANGGYRAREVWQTKRDGSIFPSLMNATLIKDKNANPLFISITAIDISEQKETEKELLKFRTISEQASYANAVTDLQGNYIYVNQAFARMHGFEIHEIIGKPMALVNSDDHLDQITRLTGLIKTQGGFGAQEIWHKRKDGSIFPALISASMISDEQKNPLFLAATFIDISDLKKAEDELRKFRTIAEQANYSVAIADLHGILIYVNKTFADAHGYEPGELIGKSLTVVHNEEQLKVVMPLVEEIKTKGGFSSEEVWHTRKDGSVFATLMNAALYKDEKGIPQFFSSTSIDITELKKSQDMLVQSEADLNTAQEIAQMGSWELNLKTGETQTSKNLYRLFEAEAENFRFSFELFLGFVHPEDKDKIRETLNLVIQSQQPANLIFRLILPSGKIKWLRSFLVPVLANDEVQILKGVSVDITESKLNEDKIIELNATLEEKIRHRTQQLADTNQELLIEIEERKRVESELMRRTEELENFFNLSLDLLCIGDLEGNLLKVSNSWEKILGYPKNEIEGASFFKYIHPEDVDKTLEGLKEISNNPNAPHFLINRYVTKDGNSIYIEWQTFPIGNYVYAAGRDVTERVRAGQFEQELLNLTPKLTGIPFNEINDVINLSLQRIGSFMKADRSYIFELNNEKNSWSNTFEWCAEGIEPQIDYLQDYSLDESPEFSRMLTNLEDIVIPSVKDMPESLRTERNMLEPQGIKSLVIIPITNENKLIGFIGLDSVDSYRKFSKLEINTLRVFGNMLASLINHRKQEEIIEQTRINYETFFNTIDDFLIIAGEEGVIIDSNKTVENRLGYTKNEIIGHNILMGYSEESYAEVMEMSFKNREGLIDSFSIPIKTKNGELIPVETRLKRGLWNGKPAVFCVSKDISAIKLSEEKFSSAFHSNAAIMAITTVAEGKFIDVNNAFLKTLEYSFDEVKGKTVFDFNLYEDVGLRKQIIESVQNNTSVKDVEMQMTTRFGKRITGLFSADLIYIGNTRCLLVTIIDITERKESEMEITRQAGLITSMLDSIPDVIFYKDIEGVYLGCNPPFAAFVGKPKNEVIGKTDYELFDRETAEFFRMNDKLMLQQEKLRHNEEWVTYPDGRVVLFDTIKISYKAANGELIGLLGISRDITERKKVEEEMIRARNEAEQANRAKSEFLSRMSHELRTPMNSILGFAQLLEMDDLNVKQRRGVNHILKSGKHLLNLINEVLDITRIEAGRLSLSIEPVQVNKVIHEVIDIIKPLASERQLTVEFIHPQSDIYYVKADIQRLKQVLLNLLNNAVKYNKPSGLIMITIQQAPEHKDNLIMYRISITDTGVGISDNDLAKLFKPFERIGHERSEIEGTGLGLAVVKKLLEAMNGRFGVESKIDVGSTFWIELPHADNQAESTVNDNNTASGNDDKNKTGVVLYIEDNMSNIELVDQILLSQRPEIKLVTSQYGMQTVQLAAEHKPDLILLDLNLPDIHGLEAMNQIILDERVRSIPVVVVSADAMPNQINRLLRAGAADYLAKPIDVVVFLNVIDKFFSKPASHPKS